MKRAILTLLMGMAACACATVDQHAPEPRPLVKASETKIASLTIPQMPQVTLLPAIAKTTPPKPKFKPLVYGEKKPLVCQKQFPATGRMLKRPNLQVMWENFLYDRPQGIWSEIGGLVERNGNLPFDQGRWTNACAVRLSHMLNKASFKIPKIEGKTVSGGNRDQYIFRLADLEAYLLETFGKPDIAILDGTGNSFDLPSKPGIVLTDLPDNSFTGHISIWNGAGTVDGSEVGGFRVLFWELPCFMPASRNAIVSNDPTMTTNSVSP